MTNEQKKEQALKFGGEVAPELTGNDVVRANVAGPADRATNSRIPGTPGEDDAADFKAWQEWNAHPETPPSAPPQEKIMRAATTRESIAPLTNALETEGRTTCECTGTRHVFVEGGFGGVNDGAETCADCRKSIPEAK